jgi:translocation and assembly module TamB
VKHQPWVFGIQITLLTLFVFASILFTPVIMATVDQNFRRLKDETIASLEEQLGKKISYSSISPSIFQFLEIRDLVVFDQRPGDFVSVSKLIVFYDIFALVSGDSDDLIQEMRIENSTLAVNLERDAQLIADIQSILDQMEEGDLPPWRLSGRNLRVLLEGDWGTLGLEELGFDWETQGESVAIDLWGDLRGTDDQERLYYSQVSVTGNIGVDLASATLRATLNNAATPFGSADNLSFQASIDENLFSLTKIEDIQPWDVAVTYDLLSQDISASLRGEDFVPGNFLSFAGPLTPFKPYLNISYTGTMGGSWNLREATGDYNFNIPRVVLPPELLGQRLTISALGRGTERRLDLQELEAQVGSGELAFSGYLNYKEFLPLGLFRFRNFSLSGSPALSGLVDTRIEIDQGYSLVSRNLVASGVPIPQLSLRYNRDLNSPALALDFQLPIETPGYSPGRVQLDMRFPQGIEDLGSYSGSVYFDRIQVGQLLKFLPRNPQEQMMTLGAFNSFLISNSSDINSEEGQLRIEGYRLLLEDANNLSHRLESPYVLDETGLRLEPITIRWDELDAQARSQITWDQEGDILIQNQLSTLGLSYAVDVNIDSRTNSVTFDGDYGIRGEVKSEQDGSLDFTLNTQNLPLPLPGGSWSLSIDGSGLWRNNEDFDLYFDRSEFTYLPIDTENEWTIVWQGRLNPQELHFNTLSLDVLDQSFEGEMRFTRRNLQSFDTDFILSMAQRNSGSINASGLLSLTDSSVDWNLRDINLQTLPLDMEGIFNANASIEGPLLEPSITFSSRLRRGVFRGEPLLFDVSGQWEKNVLDIRELTARFAQSQLTNFQGTVLTDRLGVNGQGVFSTQVGSQPFFTRIKVETGEQREINNSAFSSIVPIGGTLNLTGITFGAKSVPNQTIRFFKFQDTLTFQGGFESAISGRYRDNGSFLLNISPPSPLAFQTRGTFVDGNLNATIQGVKGNIVALSSFFPVEGVQIKDGQLGGSLSVVGPIDDPEIRGVLEAQNLRMDAPVVTTEIIDSSIRLDFRGREVLVRDNNTLIGNSLVGLKGDFGYDHWNLRTWKIGLSVPPFAPVPIDLTVVGLDLNGGVTGEYLMEGNLLDFKIGGDILLQDMQVGLNLEQSEDQESSLDTFVDLRVRTGRSVRFIWPNNNFPILLAFTDPGQELSINFNGADGTFFLRGDLNIRGGEINYLNRRFLLKAGAISFNENVDKFDPRIDISGELRTRNADGVVRLFLYAKGALSNFRPRFTSIPAMSQEELAALIGTSVILPEDYTAFDADSAVSLLSDLGSTVLIRPFEERVREVLDLDIFAFRTDIVKRAILGQGEEVSFQDYIDNTSLFLGKYLGEELFVEGLISFKSEDTLNGNADLSQEIVTELELGLELQTPLFLLNWKFNPQNPEDLFLTDHELALSWEFLF